MLTTCSRWKVNCANRSLIITAQAYQASFGNPLIASAAISAKSCRWTALGRWQ
jgi:hypothetical protein